MWPAIICSIGYIIIAIILYSSSIPVQALQELSLSATAPVLFLIGLKITASSMLSDAEKGIQGSRPSTTGTLYYYLPAAATALVTHVAGLTVGLPVGVLIYTMYALANRTTIEVPVGILAGLSLFICILLSFVVFTQKADDPKMQFSIDRRGCHIPIGPASPDPCKKTETGVTGFNAKSTP